MQQDETGIASLEAFAALRDMAEKKFGAVPADALAHQVLHVTQGADWPVKRAAMSALLRRSGFAARDELRVAKRPGGGKRLGIYTTRVPGRNGHRPYRTLLEGVQPISGNCDCRDLPIARWVCANISSWCSTKCSTATESSPKRSERARSGARCHFAGIRCGPWMGKGTGSPACGGGQSVAAPSTSVSLRSARCGSSDCGLAN